MKNEREATLLRKELDGVLKKLRKIPATKPKRGWICEVRDALEMTGEELARRLEISSSALSSLQNSEVREGISLGSLRRAARAMKCDLVYAIVPKKSLEHIVMYRRKKIAFKELTSLVSARELRSGPHAGLIAFYAKRVKRHQVWQELPEEKLIKEAQERLAQWQAREAERKKQAEEAKEAALPEKPITREMLDEAWAELEEEVKNMSNEEFEEMKAELRSDFGGHNGKEGNGAEPAKKISSWYPKDLL